MKNSIRPNMIQRAKYVVWSRRACTLANDQWRARTSSTYQSDTIMVPAALDLHLFEWAVESGRMTEPPKPLDQCLLAYVARVFAAEPEAVKSEARRYWGEKVAEKSVTQQETL